MIPVLTICAGLMVGASADAQNVDPHELFERHCAGCHAAHAGDFVTESLARRGAGVIGRNSGVSLEVYLLRGHGRLAAVQVPVMVAHLTAILDAGALFHDRCRICHDRAVLLVRRELIARDGRIAGRYTGRDIRAFLETHGRLQVGEAETIMNMLQRQLAAQ